MKLKQTKVGKLTPKQFRRPITWKASVWRQAMDTSRMGVYVDENVRDDVGELITMPIVRLIQNLTNPTLKD